MIEPYKESDFQYRGLRCVVLFMPMGYRCGYVGFAPKQKMKPDFINCHCGITYQRKYLRAVEDSALQWVGFDCGHACDGLDTEKAKEYFRKECDEFLQRFWDEKKRITPPWVQVRTLEYCEEQCRRIADQIIERGWACGN